LLKWARSQHPPCPWDNETLYSAATEGRVEVLQWMRSVLPPASRDSEVLLAIMAAGSQAHLSAPPAWDSDQVARVAACGQVDVSEWARLSQAD